MKVKVSEATNIQLDWMVAKAQGIEVVYHDDGITRCVMRKGSRGQYAGRFDPTTDWSQGGPIIEREWLHVEPWPNESAEDRRWSCTQYDLPIPTVMMGPTPLIAAMRCFVASRLGEEVEVPEELT